MEIGKEWTASGCGVEILVYFVFISHFFLILRTCYCGRCGAETLVYFIFYFDNRSITMV